MTIRVYLNSLFKRAETSALLDSGATENFINPNYAKELKLPIEELAEPRKVFNVDGTQNRHGQITHYTDLDVRTGDQTRTMRFFLTNLGEQKVILGYPWFAAVQPVIDWAKGWIAYEQLPVVIKARIKRTTTKIHTATATDRQTLASKLAEKHAAQPSPIPKEYRRHSFVFSEAESKRFPPPREWDHAIELKPGHPEHMPGKVYALTQPEQEALATFLQEHLDKGYITESKSQFAAPFFFVKKKDGKLRPVQDYRKLNEWTRRNATPLPLIPELIARVRGASLFTKFDIRWGYNNIRIRDGDQWKAAFVTNHGLFEPQVMFFGMTNSPATFQTMMNALFREELRQDWLSIYMDDILIHTRSDLPYHRTRVHQILDKLRKHDLFLKPEKCVFEAKEVEFLGVILGHNTIRMDPAKVQGVADWKPPRTVRDVRAFLGFTGYYRYFIKDYSKIARPLIHLTKKATPFAWGEAQITAFETLKKHMCQNPILRQPDYTKPFFLATDASAYGVGAVLLQEGDKHPRKTSPTKHPIAYYSATFTPTERNYDIYERELLALMKALAHWRPHLAGSTIPVTVLTDHANLTFWKSPRKVNRRVARWFAELQEYHLKIQHVPGKLHTSADLLSRPPGVDRGETDNQDLTLLHPDAFIRLSTTEDPKDEWWELERRIGTTQRKYPAEIAGWIKRHKAAMTHSHNDNNLKHWRVQGKIAVPPDDTLKKEILHRFHDLEIRGHPGRDPTITIIRQHFWWPDMNEWIAQYVRGCAKCQQGKNLTKRAKVPLYRIPTPTNALPFQIVAMDLITQLPTSKGYDAILTIVDHGCTRAAVFLPCKTTITGQEVAKLYYDNVYRWFGLPDKVISDRDPRFTSFFAKALAQQLGIKQNVSSAFHPQTDGLSERTNQWIEQYLRLTTNNAQTDWSDWLGIATTVHNNHRNATINIAPSEALLGYTPRLHPTDPPPSLNQHVEDRKQIALERRAQAIEAINRTAHQTPPPQFNVDQEVWLEAKNLRLPYQTPKLAPKRHGPFRISKQVSPVAYQLQLPNAWKIHNVFHASLLTPYRETPQHGPNYIKPPPELIEGEHEYEVEAIVNHRLHGKRKALQYLLKWKGYPDADNTWEPAPQVHAPALIEEYHQRRPLEQPHKRTGLRTRSSILSPHSELLCPTKPSVSPPSKMPTTPPPRPPTPMPPPRPSSYPPQGPPTRRPVPMEPFLLLRTPRPLTQHGCLQWTSPSALRSQPYPYHPEPLALSSRDKPTPSRLQFSSAWSAVSSSPPSAPRTGWKPLGLRPRNKPRNWSRAGTNATSSPSVPGPSSSTVKPRPSPSASPTSPSAAWPANPQGRTLRRVFSLNPLPALSRITASSTISPSPSKAAATTAASPPTSNFSTALFPAPLVPWEALTTLSLLQRSTPSPAPTSVCANPPVPKWLLRAIDGDSEIFDAFALEVQDTTQDWGLYTDICRYHHTDVELTNIASRIRALEAEEAETRNTLANCRRRLRAANAGETLAHLAGNDADRHDQRHGAGIIRYATRGRARI
jgi:hypothetical protein